MSVENTTTKAELFAWIASQPARYSPTVIDISPARLAFLKQEVAPDPETKTPNRKERRKRSRYV